LVESEMSILTTKCGKAMTEGKKNWQHDDEKQTLL